MTQAFETPGPVEQDWAEAISPIEEIIEEARNGHMFILVDHEDRENEGDLVIPAQWATPDVINFMATHGRGLICLSMTSARIDELGLPLMSTNNSSRHETAFTLSIEAREGVTTGISAADRARTVQVAIDASRGAQDIATPGHVFPLRARDGGVLVRAGHTEAAVDISRLAGLNPSGVICEIMNEDGSMARLPDLVGFAQRHNLKIGTISDLISYRRRHDNLVRVREERQITSEFGGDWTMRIYNRRDARCRAYRAGEGRYHGARAGAGQDARDGPAAGCRGRGAPRGARPRVRGCHAADRGRGGAGCWCCWARPDDEARPWATRSAPQTLRPVWARRRRVLSSAGGWGENDPADQFAQAQGRGAGGLWPVHHGHAQDFRELG